MSGPGTARAAGLTAGQGGAGLGLLRGPTVWHADRRAGREGARRAGGQARRHARAPHGNAAGHNTTPTRPCGPAGPPAPPPPPTPRRNATFLVADRRFCSLLPKKQQLPPTPGMRAVPGEQHQSCHDVCESRGLACNSKDFWWLNSCSGGGPALGALHGRPQPRAPLPAQARSGAARPPRKGPIRCPPRWRPPAVMRRHFPCEKGCTIELGPDVPAYVADANQTLHKYCLITQARAPRGAAPTARILGRPHISGRSMPYKGRARLAIPSLSSCCCGGDQRAPRQLQRTALLRLAPAESVYLRGQAHSHCAAVCVHPQGRRQAGWHGAAPAPHACGSRRQRGVVRQQGGTRFATAAAAASSSSCGAQRTRRHSCARSRLGDTALQLVPGTPDLHGLNCAAHAILEGNEMSEQN